MNSNHFTWKRYDKGWRLCCDRRIAAHVVPDQDYPGVMWRVKLPGGLSDMTNLTRAKDAALGLAQCAESEKKTQRNQGAFSGRPSPVRLNGRGASV